MACSCFLLRVQDGSARVELRVGAGAAMRVSSPSPDARQDGATCGWPTPHVERCVTGPPSAVCSV